MSRTGSFYSALVMIIIVSVTVFGSAVLLSVVVCVFRAVAAKLCTHGLHCSFALLTPLRTLLFA